MRLKIFYIIYPHYERAKTEENLVGKHKIKGKFMWGQKKKSSPHQHQSLGRLKITRSQ